MINVSNNDDFLFIKRFQQILCILLFIGLLCLTSCYKTNDEKEKVIGFSQCFSNDEWRKVMNEEISTEITLSQGKKLKLIQKNANGNTQLQAKQIEELVNEGIDVLLVSPNEAQPLTDIISKVYKKGIPVIVIDRNISNSNFSAFLGGNNYRVGEIVAEMVNKKFAHKRNLSILQVTGLHLSSPAEQRRKGFESRLDPNLLSKIEYLDGNWHYNIALKKLDSLFRNREPNYDIIFAHNDEMAYAASLMSKKYGKFPAIYGVDGLQIPNGGIALVRDNQITGTVYYPPGGDKAVHLAIDILNHKKVEKYNYLNVFGIDNNNVETIYAERKRIDENHGKLKKVLSLNDSLSEILRTRNRFLLIASTLCILLIAATSFILLTIRKIKKKNKELKFRQEIIDGQYNKLFLQKNELVEVVKKMEEMKALQANYFMDSSHELKNLLTLIQLDLDEMEKTGKISRSLRNNIRKLSPYARKILSYKTAQTTHQSESSLEFKYGNVAPVVSKIFADFKPMFDAKNIDFIAEIHNTYCDFNEMAITSILSNLLNNAQKYTPENGNVEVSLHTENDQVVLTVKDNGIGISQNKINDIFKRFYKLEDDNEESFGIGLNVALSYAQKHAGNIQINSKKNQGAEFKFIFPTKQSNEIDANTNQNQNTEKILIVEDDKAIRKRLKEILSTDYNIVEADNGRIGFEKAKYESPKLIISDILMPEMDGLEMCKMLSENPKTKFIPIIILSAVDEKDTLIKAYDLGIDSYINKPFDKEHLLARVNNVLQKRKEISETGLVKGDAVALSQEDKEFLNKIKKILYANIQDGDFLLENIATQLGMSRSKFYRKIKEITNESPVHLIRDYKLEYAAQIILKKDITVAETAMESGFSDAKYFTKCFYQKYNIYPSHFKKEYK